MSSVLVGLIAYTGLRPQEALALHWYAVRERTLLVELANADGELDRLKNRKRSRKRSRTVDLMRPVIEDLKAWRADQGGTAEGDLVFPHDVFGGLWLEEHYKTWRRRIYVWAREAIYGPSQQSVTRVCELARQNPDVLAESATGPRACGSPSLPSGPRMPACTSSPAV